MSRARAGRSRLTVLTAAALASPAAAADTLNAYSLGPENWARPMLPPSFGSLPVRFKQAEGTQSRGR